MTASLGQHRSHVRWNRDLVADVEVELDPTPYPDGTRLAVRASVRATNPRMERRRRRWGRVR